MHIQIPAAGAPGYHCIDIYPSPYQEDHPGDALHAFHVVVRIVP